MIIRKLYKFEAAHIVRKCSTKRCSRSIHGHSYKVELFIESGSLDNGDMVIDFGLLKPNIADFLDSFDHCMMVWKEDLPEFIDFIKKYSERYIIFPVSPTAENIALLILYITNKIIKNTMFSNGEDNAIVKKIIVHETATGYAEANYIDLDMINYTLNDIVFSDAIKNDWSNDIINSIISRIQFNNIKPDSHTYCVPEKT
jgi:6-pyruvoyltetrahydropterin/6-carboxytetrahydropterin synthase